MTAVILIYICSFLLWFCLLWFDSMLQFPFAVVFLIGVILSVLLLMKSPNRRNGSKIQWIILLPFMLVCMSIALLFLPLGDYKVTVDHSLFRDQRLKVVKEIQQRQPPVLGAVKLPHWWLSEDGEAYVYQAGDKLLVGFWVARGMLSPSWSVVYTAQDIPPSAEDMHCDQVEVVKKLSPHWYYLHFD